MLLYNAISNNPTCYNLCNGNITVTGAGGIPPYSYLWNNGTTLSFRNNLCAGSYSVTVYDAVGDSIVASKTLTQPASLTTTNSYTNYGNCSDTIFLSVSGGTTPYSYSWSTGNTGSSTLANVCTGYNYSTTVTDANGCRIIVNLTPGAGTLNGQTVNSLNNKCFGECNGWAVIAATGGAAPYVYVWNTSPLQSGDSIGNLCAGTYTVTISDAIHDTIIKLVTITQPASLNTTFTYTSHGFCNDTVFAHVSGGVGPYLYNWGAGDTMASYLTDVCAAQAVSVTVTDANGCQHSSSMILPSAISSCYSFDDINVPATNKQQAFNIYGNGHTGFLSDWHASSGTPSISASGDIPGVNAYDGNQYALIAVCNSGNNSSEGLEVAYNFAAGNSYKVTFAIRNAPEAGHGTGAVDMKFVLLQDTIAYVYNSSTGCSPTPAIPTTGAKVVDSIINFTTNAWTLHSFVVTGLTQNYSQLWLRGQFNNSIINTADILIDSMCIQPLSSNVWPGDANNDGIANNFDILTLGLNYLDTGIVRQSASIAWVGQPCTDWTNSTPSGQNEKYADCNGNGTIDANDTLAVTNNYGLVHLKADAAGAPTYPRLFIQFPANYFVPSGQILDVPIYLGDNQTPVSALYGIAFSTTYDTTLVTRGTAELSHNGTWVDNTGNNLLTFRKDLYDEGRIDVTMVRTNKTNVAGMGKICTLGFVMKDDISGKVDDTILKPFIPTISRVRAIMADGTIVPINYDNLPDTAWVTQVTGIANIETTTRVKVYPNPAGNYIIVDPGETRIDQYTITDVMGRNMMIVSGTYGYTRINTSSFAEGMYFLRATAGKEIKTVRFTIIR